MLRDRATPVFAQDILGHAKIDVTRNVYGKNGWEQRAGTLGLAAGQQ
jgi:hypothetical protein